MNIVDLILDKYKSVSIIGTAKNAGKTVTLNRIIEECIEKNINIGISSTGRDGETKDVLTNTEKPSIYANEGTIITTTTKLISLNEAKIDILEITDFRSPLGNIVIGKLKEDGFVQIAGPQTNKEMKVIIEKLIKLGSKFVLIDGSINRKASASPSISDACILCTGAVVSRDMNRVIEETAHLKNLFNLDKVDLNIDNLFENITNGVSIIDKNNTVKNLNIKTSINSGDIIASQINEDTKYVMIFGSLVKKTAIDIVKNTKHRNFKIVVKDATKIFINSKDWIVLNRNDIKFEVIQKINLIAITLNPYSIEGYYFNSDDFLFKTKDIIKDIPVIDVVKL